MIRSFLGLGLGFALFACGASSRTTPGGGDGSGTGGTRGGMSGSATGGNSGRGGASGLGGSGGKAGSAGSAGLTADGTIDYGYVPSPCIVGFPAEGCTFLELAPGGPCACGGRNMPPLDCTNAQNECCADDECAEGRCLPSSASTGPCCSDADCVNGGTCDIIESIGFGACFVGEPTDPFNRCVADECESDEDCADGFCSAVGVFPTRICIRGSCKTHDDCTRRPGGLCSTVTPECAPCSERDTWQTACTYPGDGCTSSSVCPEGSVCDVRDGFAACRPGTCTAGG